MGARSGIRVPRPQFEGRSCKEAAVGYVRECCEWLAAHAGEVLPDLDYTADGCHSVTLTIPFDEPPTGRVDVEAFVCERGGENGR